MMDPVSFAAMAVGAALVTIVVQHLVLLRLKAKFQRLFNALHAVADGQAEIRLDAEGDVVIKVTTNVGD
jgi:hypothetical protein